MQISLVIEEILLYKWHKFYKISLLHAKMACVMVLSEHTAVHLLSV